MQTRKTSVDPYPEHMAADVIQPVVLSHNREAQKLSPDKEINQNEDVCQGDENVNSEDMTDNISHGLHTDSDAAVAGFFQEASQKGLNRQTISVMKKDDFDSIAALKVLDLKEDLPCMDLSSTQEAILRRWVEDINSLTSSADFSVSSLLKSTDDAEVKCDTQECLKTLNKPHQLVKEIRNHLQKHGLKNLKSLLTEKVTEFLETSVNICVVGDEYVGKSTFINTLVHKSAASKGKTRSIKRKAEPKPNCCSHIPDTIFWDLPNKKWRDQKKNKDDLNYLFDAMIICSCHRFSEADLALAKIAVKDHMPVYFIRTKFDEDVINEKRDRESDFDESQLMTDIKNDISTNLAQIEMSHAKIFTLSSMKQHRTQWEFPKLKQELMTNTPKKNVEGFLDRVLCSAKIPLEKAVEDLKCNVQKHALVIVKGGKSQDLMKKQVEAYIDKLSIEGSTDTLEGFDCHLPEVEQSTKHRWRWIWLLGFGYFIGLIIDIIVTHNRREEAIQKSQRECVKHLLHLLDKLHKESLEMLEKEIQDIVTANQDS